MQHPEKVSEDIYLTVIQSKRGFGIRSQWASEQGIAEAVYQARIKRVSDSHVETVDVRVLPTVRQDPPFGAVYPLGYDSSFEPGDVVYVRLVPKPFDYETWFEQDGGPGPDDGYSDIEEEPDAEPDPEPPSEAEVMEAIGTLAEAESTESVVIPPWAKSDDVDEPEDGEIMPEMVESIRGALDRKRFTHIDDITREVYSLGASVDDDTVQRHASTVRRHLEWMKERGQVKHLRTRDTWRLV